MGRISAPVLLGPHHDLNQFRSGVEALDEWLIKHAWKNQQNGASRAFVLCEGQRVIGYYALATGGVERTLPPGNISRNMPDPIPVIVLGRLAVDSRYQGRRLGAGLLRDAMLRVLMISGQVGLRALMVHAISPEAKAFYLAYGFQVSAIDSMTLFLSIEQIARDYR